MMKAALVIGVAACGGSGPPPTPVARTIALVAPPSAPDDLQVATVNGRPVWGSCVARQAVNGKSRDVALKECVDFELLAQIAEQRGIGKEIEMDEALRIALVDRLVATAYEDKYKRPEDFGPVMAKAVAAQERKRHQLEMKQSTYLRVTIDPPVPTRVMALDEPRDGAAKIIAEKIAADLANETGLLSANLADEAAKYQTEAAMQKLKIEKEDIPYYAYVGLDKAYGDALWALPEIGRTSGAIRTKWGWDIILYTAYRAPHEMTREELEAEIFPALRREYFAIWVKSIEQAVNAKVEYIEANLPLLAEGDG